MKRYRAVCKGDSGDVYWHCREYGEVNSFTTIWDSDGQCEVEIETTEDQIKSWFGSTDLMNFKSFVTGSLLWYKEVPCP